MDKRPAGGTDRSSRRRWSLVAGGWAFLLSVGLLSVFLGPVARVIGELLGRSAGVSGVFVAVPVGVVGAAVWFSFVEERASYTYRAGAVYGLVTAVGSVLVWLILLVIVFGPVALLGWTVALFVLAVSLPLALAAGLTTMAARRRLRGWVAVG